MCREIRQSSSVPIIVLASRNTDFDELMSLNIGADDFVSKPYNAQVRIRNRTARWFAIYFPEYKDVYGDYKAVSGRMVLKEAPLPEDIHKLGAEGVNRIWRDAKLRGAGMKRAKTLVSAAGHSVGSKEAPGAARMELKNLLNDMDVYTSRLEELLLKIEEKLKEIPYVDKLMGIKGIQCRQLKP